MKKLDNVFKKKGFDYNLISRTDTKAIYEQSFEGNLISHEVFKIKIAKESEVFGTVIPAHEKFPSDNDFGSTAWSIRSIEKAMKRYHELS